MRDGLQQVIQKRKTLSQPTPSGWPYKHIPYIDSLKHPQV